MLNASACVKDSRDGATISIRVSPRASRTAITGILGEGDAAVLKVALQAPPVDGRANAALIEFMAEVLDVPRSAVEVVGGQQSRNKMFRIRGKTSVEIIAILNAALGLIRS